MSEFSNLFPVRTQRHFNVHTTSSQRCGRCMNVETTLWAYKQGSGNSNFLLSIMWLPWYNENFRSLKKEDKRIIIFFIIKKGVIILQMALFYLLKDQLIIAEISFKIASESLSGYINRRPNVMDVVTTLKQRFSTLLLSIIYIWLYCSYTETFLFILKQRHANNYLLSYFNLKAIKNIL